MKEGLNFYHDSSASRDPKMLLLRAECGLEGLAIFWMVVEMLREQNGYAAATSSAMLGLCCGIAAAQAEQVLRCAVDVGLFEILDNDKFHAPSLTRRMQERAAVIEKRRSAGKKGAAKTNASRQSRTSADGKNSAKARQAVGIAAAFNKKDLINITTLGSNDPNSVSDARTPEPDSARKPKTKNPKIPKPAEPEPEKIEAAKGVFLTQDEQARLESPLHEAMKAAGLPVTAKSVAALLEAYALKKEARGLAYRSDYAAIRNWGIDAYIESSLRRNNTRTGTRPGNGSGNGSGTRSERLSAIELLKREIASERPEPEETNVIDVETFANV